MTDLLIVGAGPAGMSAAIEAAGLGKTPVVIDDRPEPGGNIYAFLGSNRTARRERLTIFGPDYVKGAKLLDSFKTAVNDEKIIYLPSTRLWRLEADGAFAFDGPDGAKAGKAVQVLLATGAHERPMPIPGWTLPSVMGVGAAQIHLKSGGDLPEGKIVIIGTGPLPLLLAEQLARAGRPIHAMIEPAGSSRLIASTLKVFGAVAAPKIALKGLGLLVKRLFRRTPVYRNATEIEITGTDRATGVRFKAGKGYEIAATTVLIHDGIIPNLNPIRAADLNLVYSDQQQTWHAVGNNVIHVAGDGAGILGVNAAIMSGRMAARRICGEAASSADRRGMARQRAFREFIDRAYPPVQTAKSATSETVLCRCEMIRASTITEAIETHGADPNAIKRALRIGMGPCQGRLCSHSLADFAAKQNKITTEKVGLPRARNPILPVSFATLAELQD